MTQSALYDRILKSAEYINRISRSGGANYIVTSQQVSDTIRDILKDRSLNRLIKIKKIWNID